MEVLVFIPVEAGEAEDAAQQQDKEKRQQSQRLRSRECPARRDVIALLFGGASRS
jgi:hypothetical protein